MSKRTTTSKGLRDKTRKLNRTNESLAADLKTTRLALGKAMDLINKLQGDLYVLKQDAIDPEPIRKRDTSDTEETVSPPE